MLWLVVPLAATLVISLFVYRARPVDPLKDLARRERAREAMARAAKAADRER